MYRWAEKKAGKLVEIAVLYSVAMWAVLKDSWWAPRLAAGKGARRAEQMADWLVMKSVCPKADWKESQLAALRAGWWDMTVGEWMG